MKTLQDSLTLTGFARLSPRLYFLKRLAFSDDPVASLCARTLIQDRAARRYGAWYEFTKMFLGPVLLCMFYFMTVLIYNQSQQGIGSFMGTGSYGYFSLMNIMMIVGSISGIVALISFLTGIMVVIWPVSSLLRREGDGLALRLTTLTPEGVWVSLMKVQLASYLLPALVLLIVSAVVAYAQYSQIGSYPAYVSHIHDSPVIKVIAPLLLGIIGAIFTMAGGIYTGMKYREIGPSFFSLLVYTILFAILTTAAFYLIPLRTAGAYLDLEYNLILGTIASVITGLVFMAVIVKLSFNAVRSRVMPSK